VVIIYFYLTIDSLRMILMAFQVYIDFSIGKLFLYLISLIIEK